ncbi:MAG: hypothetical protein SF162_01970 [bacterium]|nr:hypothetical protein [bacterium]
MIDEVFFGSGGLISAFFLVRLALIHVGLLKEPVLRQLQSYSDSYIRYYPLPAVLIWSGMLWICGGISIMQLAGSRFPLFLPGVLFLCGAWISVQAADWLMHHQRWMLPRWYRDLDERADRDEQRRIAYAWLRLPRPLRRTLNVNDRAFAAWTDLVILSSGISTGDMFVYARHYRILKTRTARS